MIEQHWIGEVYAVQYVVARGEGLKRVYLVNWIGPGTREDAFVEQRPRPVTGLFSTRRRDARRFEHRFEAAMIAARIPGCEAVEWRA